MCKFLHGSTFYVCVHLIDSTELPNTFCPRSRYFRIFKIVIADALSHTVIFIVINITLVILLEIFDNGGIQITFLLPV